MGLSNFFEPQDMPAQSALFSESLLRGRDGRPGARPMQSTRFISLSSRAPRRLRHTFNTRLLEQGADLMTVQQLLGHSTVTVTMRYAHLNLDSKRSATSKLDDFGESLVTPCTTMQQTKSKVSPIAPLSAVASYN